MAVTPKWFLESVPGRPGQQSASSPHQLQRQHSNQLHEQRRCQCPAATAHTKAAATAQTAVAWLNSPSTHGWGQPQQQLPRHWRGNDSHLTGLPHQLQAPFVEPYTQPTQPINGHQPPPWLQQRQHGAQPQQQQQQLQLQQRLPITPTSQARCFTAAITRSSSAAELLAVLSRYEASLNYIHISAMLAKLAKLPAGEASAQHTASPASTADAAEAHAAEDLIDALLPRLEQHLPQFGPRALANTMWALAKLGRLPPRRIVAALLAELDGKVVKLQPQEHSMALYAMAEWQRQLLQRVWERVSLQHAAASWQQQQPQQHLLLLQHQALQPTSPPLQQQQQQQQGNMQYQLMPPKAVSSRLAAWSRRELALSNDRLAHYLGAASAIISDFGPQAVSNMLYAIASMGVEPAQLQPWLPRFWEASGQLLASSPCDFELQHLSNLMWAHGKLGLAPPQQWLAAWCAATQPRLSSFTPQGCSNMLWGLAKAGADPGAAWLRLFVHATAARLASFSEHAVSNCSWALARMVAWDGSSTGGGDGGNSSNSNSSQCSENAGEGSCGSVGEHSGTSVSRPVVLHLLQESGWVRSMLEVSHRRLGTYSPQQLVNTIWALGMVGVQPSAAWMAAFVEASEQALCHMSPQELSMALVSCARMGYHPGSAWMGSFEAAAGRLLGQCRPQHLANIVWALAQLQHKPSQQWQAALLLECTRRLATGRPQQRGAGGEDTGHALLLPQSTWPMSNPTASSSRESISKSSSSDGSNPQTMPTSIASSSASSSSGDDEPPAASAFTMQGLANLAWGVAKLELPVPATFWAVLDADATLQLADASSQAISMLLWAMATVGVAPSPACLTAALQAAAQKLPGVSPQGVSMLLWALAKLEARPDPELLLPLVEHAGQCLCGHHAHGPNGIAGDVSASSSSADSTAGSSSRQTACTSNGRGCEDSAIILWALAKLGFYPGQAWMGAWLEASRHQLGMYSARQLAMVLWALAVLAEAPPGPWMAAWRTAWADRLQTVAAASADADMVAAAFAQLSTTDVTVP